LKRCKIGFKKLGIEVFTLYPTEAELIPIPIAPCSISLDVMVDLPKFYPFLQKSSITFWQEFLTGPQLDLDFGECSYLDDFWVKDRSKDLQALRQFQLPLPAPRQPPPMVLRSRNNATTREDDELNVDEFKEGNMCIIDGTVPDGETGPALWVAKIVNVNINDRTLDVTYYDKKDRSKAYFVIDAMKVSTIDMGCVLVPFFKLNKNNTMPVKIKQRASDLSQARLLIGL
jgi:hypothetical protein